MHNNSIYIQTKNKSYYKKSKNVLKYSINFYVES